MQASAGNRAQSFPADGIVRRHKDTDGGLEEIFQIFAAISHPPRQIMARLEFRPTIWLIVIVAVEHCFEASCHDPLTEVFHKRPVFVQGVDRPLAAELLWNAFACPRSAERDYSKGDGTHTASFTVGTLKIFGRGEKARVIITNTEMHLKGPLQSGLYLVPMVQLLQPFSQSL
jgi:hypothetical protein